MAEGRVFALLGHPVSHSLSPVIHAAAYEALGFPHVYTTVDAPTQADVAHAIDALRAGSFGGMNVTLPHKRAALEMSDVVDASAVEPGVANVLCRDDAGRIHAYNTDADALADDIAGVLNDAPSTQGTQAIVIGAGGAGFAAVVACRKLGYKRIGVTSRSWISPEYIEASAVVPRMRSLGALTFPWPTNESEWNTFDVKHLDLKWLEFARGASLVVQATSAGMLGADPGDPVANVVPWAMLGERTLAYDVVYTPRVTPFIQAAMTHGVRVRGGLGMLVRQAARSILLWTGQSPPIDMMVRAAEETLDRRGHTA